MIQPENAELELRVAKDTAAESHSPAPNFFFPELLIILAKRRFPIFWFVGSAALIAIGGSLLLHNTLKAYAKIMPPQFVARWQLFRFYLRGRKTSAG